MSLDHRLDGDSTRPGDRTEATDFALALTAGPNAWVTPGSAATPMVRAGLALALTGFLAMTTVTLSQVLYQDEGRSGFAQLCLSVATVLAMGTLASSAVAAIMRQGHHGGRHGMLVYRVGAVMIFSVIWVSTVPPPLSLLIWPVGLSIGAEAAITARLIGHNRRMITLLRNYLLSPLHLGAVSAALAGQIVADRDAVDRIVICAVCSLEVAALSSIAAYGVLVQLFDREAQHIDAIQTKERTEEFHRRAHWIHDDVCADLREIRVKMAAQVFDQAQISRELDLLDDRLRERQLDEMLHGGEVAAAEIIQSYVRRAQTAGVFIVEVPRFEEASVMLGGEPARLLRRCAAGFVSNALAAGTRSLGFQLAVDGGDLVFAVSDDAGGFDLAEAPAGRGLASLARELGVGRMTSARSVRGTTMTALIPLDATRLEARP